MIESKGAPSGAPTSPGLRDLAMFATPATRFGELKGNIRICRCGEVTLEDEMHRCVDKKAEQKLTSLSPALAVLVADMRDELVRIGQGRSRELVHRADDLDKRAGS